MEEISQEATQAGEHLGEVIQTQAEALLVAIQAHTLQIPALPKAHTNRKMEAETVKDMISRKEIPAIKTQMTMIMTMTAIMIIMIMIKETIIPKITLTMIKINLIKIAILET